MGKVEKAIQQMEAWANDDSHGYDQTYRWGQKGDYDCSAAVIQSWENAGVPVKTNGATYTGNMLSVFEKCGFKDVTSSINLSTGSGLKRGDVLLNVSHHTAMYCGNGKEVEASINEKGTATGGTPGDQTGKEFLIRSYRNYPWTNVLRYEESSGSGSSTGSAGSGGSLNKTAQWTGTVTASELNVRTWAGTGNATCSFSPLKKGTKVEVCDSIKASDGSTWYYIKYSGKYGFVHSNYISKSSGSSSSGSTGGSSSTKKVDYAQSQNSSLAGTYKVTASDGLNLRTGAGTGKAKITAMPKGAKCQCYGYYTTVSGVKWLLVVYNGQEGFASSQYLQKC